MKKEEEDKLGLKLQEREIRGKDMRREAEKGRKRRRGE